MSYWFPVNKLLIFKPESNFLFCCFNWITAVTDVPNKTKKAIHNLLFTAWRETNSRHFAKEQNNVACVYPWTYFTKTCEVVSNSKVLPTTCQVLVCFHASSVRNNTRRQSKILNHFKNLPTSQNEWNRTSFTDLFKVALQVKKNFFHNSKHFLSAREIEC